MNTLTLQRVAEKMKKFINSITANIPYTKSVVHIKLAGKNLIITGANGSGKTSLVKGIYSKLSFLIIEKNLDKISQYEGVMSYHKNGMLRNPEGSSSYINHLNNFKDAEKFINKVRSEPKFGIENYMAFYKAVDDHVGIVEFFPAIRESNIKSANSASGTKYSTNVLKEKDRSDNVGSMLEQHLVNLYTRRSFAITDEKNNNKAQEITIWLENFDKNLKMLMEDNSTKLHFSPQEFKVYINKEGREPYTFQTLSSGYSAVFSIISSLMMRAECLGVSPNHLCGVCIIDEIDAHLHVSLQRKIFPFLTDLFKNIQFIVTTHSPFVVTSVQDAVVFDVSTYEQVENLYTYSYDAVLEGLFGVKMSSNILEEKIKAIVEYMDGAEVDLQKLKIMVDEVDDNIGKMDEESRYFVKKAQLLIAKKS